MSRTASTKIKDPKGAELWLACAQCNGTTCHKQLALVAESDESPGGDIQVWNDYSVLQCSGCKALSFCIESSCSEDIDFDPYTGQRVLGKQHTLYPSRVSGRPQFTGIHELPTGVYRIYTETHKSLCSENPILTGVGIRAILEAVCTEKSTTGKLYKQIDQLYVLGLISKDSVDFLHGLRFLGNKAAHETKAHSPTELNAAFDLIDNLLHSVYVLPKIAAKIPQQSPPKRKISSTATSKKKKSKSKKSS